MIRNEAQSLTNRYWTILPGERGHAYLSNSFVDRPRHRPGTVLPLVALTIVAQLSFLALAIDLGMMAISKTQAQQAADLVALTAARSLNGSPASNYNQNLATTNGQNILTHNRVLGKSIASSQLQLTFGSYDYNQSTQSFGANYPAPDRLTDHRGLCHGLDKQPVGRLRCRFGYTNPADRFGDCSGGSPTSRPCSGDGPSGSMRMGTCLGFDFYPSSRTCNNPDPLIPTFGALFFEQRRHAGTIHKSDLGQLQLYDLSEQHDGDQLVILQNLREQFLSKRRLCLDPRPSIRFLYQHRRWQHVEPADIGFASASPDVLCLGAGRGRAALQVGKHDHVCHTVKDVLNSSTTNILWELDGYSAYYNGSLDTSGPAAPTVWTQADYSAIAPIQRLHPGPGYYGKTFFIWPPDPRNTTTPTTLEHAHG